MRTHVRASSMLSALLKIKNIMDIGYFKYVDKEGEDPIEVPGEKIAVLPKGYSKQVELGIFRIDTGFAACHFGTGLKIHRGKRKQDAIDAGTEWLEKVKEITFTKLLESQEIINTEIRPHYGK